MGQAKRRKQQLGDLYGTPEGSNRNVIPIAEIKRRHEYTSLPGLDQTSPDGYLPYAELAVRMVVAYAYLTALELSRSVDASAAAAAAISWAGLSNAPLLHLSHQQVHSFLDKPSPSATNRVTFPSGVFILNLPQGLLLDRDGEPISALVVASGQALIHWLRTERVELARERYPALGTPAHPLILPHQDSDIVIAAPVPSGEIDYIHRDWSTVVKQAFADPSHSPTRLARLALNSLHWYAGTIHQLEQLGFRVRGRDGEGDVFWIWLALQIRLIAGEHLTGAFLDQAVFSVAHTMDVDDLNTVCQILWVEAGDAFRGTLQDHAELVLREIEHANADPALYPLGISPQHHR